MKRVRAVYSTVILITAALLFWSARVYVLGILVVELAFPILLRMLLFEDRRQMQISIETRPASVAGQNLSIYIQVRGRRWIAAGMLDAVLEVENKLLGAMESIPVTIGLSRRAVSVYLPYTPKGCGQTEIRLKQIQCCDVMGLNTVTVDAPKPARVTVYPESLPLGVSTDSSLSGFQEGAQQTISRRGSDPSEVFELREYRPGDDIRTIHWKLSGKTEELLVKESSDTSHYSTMVLLDAGLKAETDRCGEELLSAAVGLALTFSEKLLDLGVLHYIGLPAQARLFFRQVTERAEYVKMTDTWMGLTLEEQAGEGLKLFLADPLYSGCRHMIYITAGAFSNELDMIPVDMRMTAICIQPDGDEVRVTRKGLGVLMEIPQKRLKESVYNIAI